MILSSKSKSSPDLDISIFLDRKVKFVCTHDKCLTFVSESSTNANMQKVGIFAFVQGANRDRNGMVHTCLCAIVHPCKKGWFARCGVWCVCQGARHHTKDANQVCFGTFESEITLAYSEYSEVYFGDFESEITLVYTKYARCVTGDKPVTNRSQTIQGLWRLQIWKMQK